MITILGTEEVKGWVTPKGTQFIRIFYQVYFKSEAHGDFLWD